MNRNLTGSLQKYFIFVTLVAATIYLCMYFVKNKSEIGLFMNDSEFLIKNIMDDEITLLNSNSSQIFFLETHLDGRRNLTSARQACSVESAARTNPDLQIYLLLATNETQMTMIRSPLYEALAAYPNIHIRYINLLEFSIGTPLEQFMIENKLEKSKFRIEHTSDVMRILTLYKYGGLYMDLDVLSIFPVRIIDRKNFVCLEGNNHFSNAIIRLDLNEGKKFSSAYVEKIRTSYDSESWAANGPNMISPAFRSFCNGTNLVWDKGGECEALTAIPNQKCFVIMHNSFTKFYEPEFYSEIFDRIKQVGGYFIHIWNKMLEFNNKQYKLDYDSKAAYVELAKVYCPRVVDTRISF